METLNEKWSSILGVATKLLLVIVVPAVGFRIARFWNDYQAWLDMGPGGMPHNVLGFSVNLLLTGLFARKETKSLQLYDQPEKYAIGWERANEEEKTEARKSFLRTPLPQRAGPESKSLRFNAPQREKYIDEYFDPNLTEVNKIENGIW